jgi:hypothetical protein
VTNIKDDAPVSVNRYVTERFCSQVQDNVVIMQTFDGGRESYKCLSQDACPKNKSCKNNTSPRR